VGGGASTQGKDSAKGHPKAVVGALRQ
jgi:hypothetical protein